MKSNPQQKETNTINHGICSLILKSMCFACKQKIDFILTEGSRNDKNLVHNQKKEKKINTQTYSYKFLFDLRHLLNLYIEGWKHLVRQKSPSSIEPFPTSDTDSMYKVKIQTKPQQLQPK